MKPGSISTIMNESVVKIPAEWFSSEYQLRLLKHTNLKLQCIQAQNRNSTRLVLYHASLHSYLQTDTSPHTHTHFLSLFPFFSALTSPSLSYSSFYLFLLFIMSFPRLTISFISHAVHQTVLRFISTSLLIVQPIICLLPPLVSIFFFVSVPSMTFLFSSFSATSFCSHSPLSLYYYYYYYYYSFISFPPLFILPVLEVYLKFLSLTSSHPPVLSFFRVSPPPTVTPRRRKKKQHSATESVQRRVFQQPVSLPRYNFQQRKELGIMFLTYHESPAHR